MPIFRFLRGLRTTLARLVAATPSSPSRKPRWARLLGLSLVLTGQSSSPSAAQPRQAPPVTGAVFTLSIDGEKVPAHSYVLSNVPPPLQGFVLGIESEQTQLTITGTPSAPLAVGKYDFLDIMESGVLVTAGLPPRFDKELENRQTGFHSRIGYKEGSPLAGVYDWGAGLQELQGRKLGQMVFTRVSNGTADGSFQSYVYGVLSSKTIPYKGRERVFQKLQGHQLRGTFKNLPINNVAKAMNDLKKLTDALGPALPPPKPRR